MVIGGATLRLSTGNDMPAVGLGTWLVCLFFLLPNLLFSTKINLVASSD